MPHHDSNVEPSESKSDVLPIAPWGNEMDLRDGFEPPFAESESDVLPLDERRMLFV
jgi:hypothetical protein